mmetsp:Transcript_95122/g.296114  ORF Transcript_95122/g.296114 Transcript_95122/m.296114 type:complete len:296 (+) Transcript_95122:159-1046(+)
MVGPRPLFEVPGEGWRGEGGAAQGPGALPGRGRPPPGARQTWSRHRLLPALHCGGAGGAGAAAAGASRRHRRGRVCGERGLPGQSGRPGPHRLRGLKQLRPSAGLEADHGPPRVGAAGGPAGEREEHLRESAGEVRQGLGARVPGRDGGSRRRGERPRAAREGQHKPCHPRPLQREVRGPQGVPGAGLPPNQCRVRSLRHARRGVRGARGEADGPPHNPVWGRQERREEQARGLRGAAPRGGLRGGHHPEQLSGRGAPAGVLGGGAARGGPHRFLQVPFHSAHPGPHERPQPHGE